MEKDLTALLLFLLVAEDRRRLEATPEKTPAQETQLAQDISIYTELQSWATSKFTELTGQIISNG